jgi:hypothetical protein
MTASQLDERAARCSPPSPGLAAGPDLVVRRRLPYPYRALLAISSDLDETPDAAVYWETMRFLNTSAVGPMGPGLGLEVGNSIYFDMPRDQLAYWNTDDTGRAMVRELIKSGHIDVLHSFGDLAVSRADAARSLEELDRHGCRLEVWVDHGTAPTNFDGDIMKGSGDVRGAAAYHADLSVAHGIQFVWRGRVTSVIGQDVPRSLRGIVTLAHPLASARTVAKEWAKGVLARLGRPKYAMHGPNDVLRDAKLRSGHAVVEFLRSNPHWGGVSSRDTGAGLADVLVERMLHRLEDREGICLLYTHLGKITSRDEPFGPRTRQALRRLAKLHREGRILVTTTRRALGYCRALRSTSWSTSVDADGALHIVVTTSGAPEVRATDVQGLTFYVPDPSRIRVSIDGRGIADVRKNGPDHTGRSSVSVSWQPLEFPL